MAAADAALKQVALEVRCRALCASAAGLAARAKAAAAAVAAVGVAAAAAAARYLLCKGFALGELLPPLRAAGASSAASFETSLNSAAAAAARALRACTWYTPAPHTSRTTSTPAKEDVARVSVRSLA